MKENDCIGEECIHAEIVCADYNCDVQNGCQGSECDEFSPRCECEHLRDGYCDLPEEER